MGLHTHSSSGGEQLSRRACELHTAPCDAGTRVTLAYEFARCCKLNGGTHALELATQHTALSADDGAASKRGDRHNGKRYRESKDDTLVKYTRHEK